MTTACAQYFRQCDSAAVMLVHKTLRRRIQG